MCFFGVGFAVLLIRIELETLNLIRKYSTYAVSEHIPPSMKSHSVLLMSAFFSQVSLFKFSYWSKFYVNIITGSGVKTNFVYKGLTRNLKIGNTSI